MMKQVMLSLIVIAAVAANVAAEVPAAADSAPCMKSISFAMAEDGQPVPAIPKFAAKWIGKKSHVESYPELCLSQIPSTSTANYVVIFSTTEASFNGLSAAAHTYSSATPASGNLAGISSYGGTWSYSYTGFVAPAPSNSVSLQRIDKSKKVLVVRSYDQRGRQVSDYSVDSNHSRERLIELVMHDIHSDVAAKPSQKPFGAPLSVYYVNCDVDPPAQPTMNASLEESSAGAQATPLAHASPQPQASLEFSSNPAGADIYLDGKLVGTTPLTVAVFAGEHVVVMRKKDFTSWTRSLQVASGQRRVAASLERQFLTISSGPQ